MKYFAKLALTLVLSLLLGAIIDGAHAQGRDGGRAAPKRKTARSVSYGGDALKPKTNLKLDGRSVHSLRSGKFDTLTLGDEGLKGAKRLYSLPTDFASRSADSEMEMRYRQ